MSRRAECSPGKVNSPGYVILSFTSFGHAPATRKAQKLFASGEKNEGSKNESGPGCSVIRGRDLFFQVWITKADLGAPQLGQVQLGGRNSKGPSDPS